MNLTNDQKIEYIFNELKAQKRARYFKIFFRTTVIGFLIFLYFTFINGMTKQEIIKVAGEKLGEIIAPIVKDMVNDTITKNIPGKK